VSRPLDAEDYYDLSLPTDVAVSPDGDRVAFVVDEFDPEEDRRLNALFVVPTDGSRSPHRLTRASEAGQPVWGPNGDRLGFVAARDADLSRSVGHVDDGDEDGDGSGSKNSGVDIDENPDPQVWYFDLALGGDAVQVTDFEEGVSEFDWGPDGDRVVAAARDPTNDQAEYIEDVRNGGPIEVERLQHKADGVGFLDEVTNYLFVVDVETGESDRIDDAYAQGARAPLFGLQPTWGPNGRIAFGSNRTETPDDSGAMDLYTVDPAGEDLRRVTEGNLRASAYTWSPDGNRVAFIGGTPTNWYEPPEVYVARDAPGEYESISASLDRTPDRYGQLEFLDENTLLGPFGDEGLTRLVALDADTDDPDRTFEAQGREQSVTWFDAAGDTVVVGLTDPDGHDLYAIDADALDDEAPSTRLTGLNTDLLDGTATPDFERRRWEDSDGVEVEGMVYTPPADLDGGATPPYPTVVKIHGGPMSYDGPTFDFLVDYWTGQGYAVLCPNYRGSTSYGREFAERLKGVRGDLERDDVVTGVEHLVEDGVADPDRLFVTGFSYGGITTANVVTMEKEPFAAAAAEHGVYDFRSVFGTDDNHLWHEWEFGLPWDDPDTFEDISSITDVDNVETPLLLTAGEKDWRCPPTQAEQFYVSVRKRGVDAKLVLYQGENHDVSTPDRAVHRVETLTEWFRDHDPAVDDEDEVESRNEV
jgi:dipeptidyl aminopeptidase/acylaminoacyl peptidase